MAWDKNFCDSKSIDSNISVFRTPPMEMKTMCCGKLLDDSINGSADDKDSDLQDAGEEFE